MSTRSAESRDHSPDGSPEKRASKKRKVLSCYACRNRKMKCDRVYPVCGRCQKTGRAAQCTYDPRLLEESYMTGDTQSDGRGHVGLAAADGANEPVQLGAVNSSSVICNTKIDERRLDALEQRLAMVEGSTDHPYPPSISIGGSGSSSPKIEEEIMFRGKGLNTHFYGSTSPYTLITQFSELQSFTREALRLDNSMVRIRTDFKTFRDRRKTLMKEKRLRLLGSDEEILDQVPPKSVVDAAVALYWEQVEYIYRILHEPSFWAEYHSFWQPQQQHLRPAGFAALLILIVAVTKCLPAEQNIVFVGDISAQRESAADLIEICDRWLLHHPRKPLALAFFQLQCLSLLAKRANGVKMKQAWVHSGDVMRLALATGMHRNPSFPASRTQKISEFEKEMRRRLWGTIVELEVQSSIDTGLPSSMCGLHCDVQTPSNIPDDLLSAESGDPPSERPPEQFTRTSYLAWSANSLRLRVQLMQFLNNPTMNLQYAEVLAYDTQITSLLSSLPDWDHPQALLPSALLGLQLRQFLLMLHRPYARLAARNARFGYSFTACVNAASSIVSVHDDLRNRGMFLLNHLRFDSLRTAITLAQVVYHNSTFPLQLHSNHVKARGPTMAADDIQPTDPSSTQNQPQPSAEAKPPIQIPVLPLRDFLLATLCSTSVSIMESAQSSFEDKTLRLGTGYMEFWLMTAAMGIMPSTSGIAPTAPSGTSTSSMDLPSRGRNAIDRFTSLCFRVLALQKDPGAEFASSLGNTFASASHTPSEMQFAGTPADRVTPIMSGTGTHMGQTYMARTEGAAQVLNDPGKAIIGSEMDFGMQGMLENGAPDLSEWGLTELWASDYGGGF